MSTLRDTAERVANEMRDCRSYVANPETLRRWAADLDAAVKADADAVCECRKNLPVVLDACFALDVDTVTADNHCTICGRKVLVTP
jgi:hypothetical protein